MIATCTYTPVVFRSISGKTYAGSGDTFIEVPDGTTHEDLDQYIASEQTHEETLKSALAGFLDGKNATCPGCYSKDRDVYPNDEGICICKDCNDLFGGSDG